jgi:hypothetical protein
MSYPHLFPSGFLDTQECQGPLLYRSQPSRESNGVRLNDYMDKYNVGQYKGGDFLRLGTNLRDTSRMWNRLPENIKKDFLKLIIESDSQLSKDIINKYKKNNAIDNFENIEHFGETTDDVVDSVKNFIIKMKEKNPEYDNVVVTKKDNKMNIFIITIVSIVAIVIGFLCACTGSSM